MGKYEDKHYKLIEELNEVYKAKDYVKAEKICKEAIEIGPEVIKEIKADYAENGYTEMGIPRSPFYDKLAIIYKKNGKWQDIIDLCEKGKNEGWSNEFDKRIEEAKKKLQ